MCIRDRNKRLMSETEEITKDNSNLNLVFAFNYGSRKEIHDAIAKISKNNPANNVTIEACAFTLFQIIPNKNTVVTGGAIYA